MNINMTEALLNGTITPNELRDTFEKQLTAAMKEVDKRKEKEKAAKEKERMAECLKEQRLKTARDILAKNVINYLQILGIISSYDSAEEYKAAIQDFSDIFKKSLEPALLELNDIVDTFKKSMKESDEDTDSWGF